MLKNFFITSVRSLKRNKAYFFLGVAGLTLGIACVIALYTLISFQDRFDKHQAQFDKIYRIVGSYQVGDQSGKTSTVPHPLANGIRDELTNVSSISNLYMLSEQVNIPHRRWHSQKDQTTPNWICASPGVRYTYFQMVGGSS